MRYKNDVDLDMRYKNWYRSLWSCNDISLTSFYFIMLSILLAKNEIVPLKWSFWNKCVGILFAYRVYLRKRGETTLENRYCKYALNHVFIC